MSQDTIRIIAQQAGGKAHELALPRSATVQQLEAAVRAAAGLSAARHIALSVDGCTPAQSTVLADMCDSTNTLSVAYTQEMSYFGGLIPTCTCGWGINTPA